MNTPIPQLRIETSQFLLGDALDWLEALPDKHFALAVTSPPYNIGKPYEVHRRWSLEQYLISVEEIIARLVPKISGSGSICWQVGNYVKDGEVFPLDIYTYSLFHSRGMKLRNRIIWRFNFGHNANSRFSGRYETVLWFSKSDKYTFNLDAVRVPQLYPGKRHSATKATLAGKPSGNPKGKNPADFWEFSPENAFIDEPVWDVPNVKANHPEHTFHPCQFPIERAERCVLSLSKKGQRVIDPFVGAGTTVLAAAKHGRIGVGIDSDPSYIKLAQARLKKLDAGELPMRPLGMPVRRPKRTEKVATVPKEWTRRPKTARHRHERRTRNPASPVVAACGAIRFVAWWPNRCSAASTRCALAAGQRLIRSGTCLRVHAARLRRSRRAPQ
jgi:adenine-specific DNA-methyltransferase